MQVDPVGRSQRGATHVEYAIIVAAVSVVVMAVVSVLGGNVSGGLCGVNQGLGSSQSCDQAEPAASDGPAASDATTSDATTAAAGAGSSSTGTGSGSVAGATGGGEDSVPDGGGSGSSDQASAAPAAPAASESPTQAATNSAGTMTFYTAVVDQDQRKRDLSARVNLGWSPNSWSNVEYPQTVTIDVTWTPALEIDQVITGSSGHWDVTVVGPGHLRLTRSDTFDTGGFQPEPEILLVKPDTTQEVSVTFTATAPNTPPVSRTATTTAIPYR